MGNKTLIACVTFGNKEFTKLAIDGIRRTTNSQYDLFCIIGKPGDVDTQNYLYSEAIPFIQHNENMGFPYSINDIYDYAWKENNYDNLIIYGNDIVPYKYSIDSMIKLAEISTYEVISATQVDVKQLVSMFPETRQYFSGDNYIFSDFNSSPWEKFTSYSDILDIGHMKLMDIQNLCLYKKSIFDKVGYTDVAFYPAYFVDNDYANRLVNSNAKVCSLSNARFFHFWSRTIHQGSGGSTNKAFENNEAYYKTKWGGGVGKETKTPTTLISSRDGEHRIINEWKRKLR